MVFNVYSFKNFTYTCKYITLIWFFLLDYHYWASPELKLLFVYVLPSVSHWGNIFNVLPWKWEEIDLLLLLKDYSTPPVSVKTKHKYFISPITFCLVDSGNQNKERSWTCLAGRKTAKKPDSGYNPFWFHPKPKMKADVRTQGNTVITTSQMPDCKNKRHYFDVSYQCYGCS